MKVQISILTQGWVRKEMVLVMLNIQRRTEHDVRVELTQEQPIAHARNRIVKDFLETDREYLLMIDDDVIHNKNPLELIKSGKGVIGFPCPIFQYKKLWNVYNADKDGYYRPIEIDSLKNELQEVDAIGSGSLLIHRSVLEQLSAPFERQFNEDGTQKLGLDLSFCEKARKQGFLIYIHPQFTCKHFKELNLEEFDEKY